MRKKTFDSTALALVEHGQIIPERSTVAEEQIGFPSCVPLIDQLGHDDVLQIGCLRRNVDVAHRGLETVLRTIGGAEGIRHQVQEQEHQCHVG